VVGHVELTGRPREQAVTQVAIHTSCCFVLHLVESPGCRVFLTQALVGPSLRGAGGGGTRCGAWWRDGGWGWEVVVGLWDSQQSNGLGVRKRQSKSSRPVGQ
jgi:hypothetical protein